MFRIRILHEFLKVKFDILNWYLIILYMNYCYTTSLLCDEFANLQNLKN